MRVPLAGGGGGGDGGAGGNGTGSSQRRHWWRWHISDNREFGFALMVAVALDGNGGNNSSAQAWRGWWFPAAVITRLPTEAAVAVVDRAAGGNGGPVALFRYSDSFPQASATTGSPTLTESGGNRTDFHRIWQHYILMAHFARIENGVVQQVVVDNSFCWTAMATSKNL